MATQEVLYSVKPQKNLNPFRFVNTTAGTDTGWKNDVNFLSEGCYQYIRYDFNTDSEKTLNLKPETISLNITPSRYGSDIIHADFYDGDPFNGGTIYKSVAFELNEGESGGLYPFSAKKEDGTYVTVSDALYVRFWRTYVSGYGSPDFSMKTSEAKVYLLIPQPEVTPISPVNTENPGYQNIVFQWRANTSFGGITAATIEYSTDGETFQVLQTVTGHPPAETYTAPVKALPYGNITWRIHVTNSYGVISEYSYAVFKVLELPAVTSAVSPKNNRYVEKASPVTLSWAVSQTYGTVGKSELQYSSDDGENWIEIAETVDTTYTVPANTFPAANPLKWRVRAYNGDQVAGLWSEASINTTESTPTVSNLKPNGTYQDKTKPITLTWSASIENGQIAGSEIEYDLSDGQGFRSLDTITGTDTTYTVPANTFPAANPLKWRVRSYNRDNVVGLWSEASINIAESTPSVSNLEPYGKYQDKAKPIAITWNASIQYGAIAGAELEYDLSDGEGWQSLGTVTGDGTTYTVPANTFPAVAYTDIPHRTGGIRIRVRNKNRDDVFSAWVESSFATIDEIRTAYPISPKRNTSQNETKPIIFSCGAYTSYLRDNHTTAFDIRWRRQNGEWSDTIHFDSNITGDSGSYTFPPNTFPADIIEWQTRAYNQDNIAGEWSQETASFTTVDKPQISTALTPTGTIEDADEPITFTWATSSQSGEASRGADLQYSRDNATWINLGPSVESGPQIPGNVHEYEAPGHTIPPGSIFWRVRSYNRNMVAGDWSTAVSFVARAAPTVQDIQATAKPWATVIWQADDQQTYEIFVDGESLGSYFGAEKQFPLPDYLEDGVHTVGVRVMGSFSLWSQINETQVTIANTQAAALTLTAETNIDTALTWTGGDGDFFVYRDGLMIAHTDAHSFIDRVTLGTHEYRVIERLASGDYNASETVTQTPDVPYQHIAALAGGDWIAIPHTLKSQAEPSYQESQETAFNYLSGNDYPTASIGSHRTDVGQYSAVFLYTEEAENRAFLALRGKPVILKTADGEVMIGVLNAWERRPKSTREMKLYTAYNFSIQRIGWEDYIDDTA